MGVEPTTVEAIFGGAVGRLAEDRRRFLEDACGGNADLRRRVEVLLAAHDSAGAFLDLATLPRMRMDGAFLSEGPGSIIGPYKIVRLLGEGGFGVVFLAEQTHPVHRQVALKIIKLGMDTRQVIARFEAERQTLAMMEHPNIARVLDAGSTGQGRPYFVMELAVGVPITRYCDERKLSVSERLVLFEEVCHAVQHAHQKGIIHRDIKPSNVLVTTIDGVATPKVIDFGIAKATQGRITDVTLITEARQTIGTPTYMSPEQARSGEMRGEDIDTRSDIYALGVLLYELLTGGTPFTTEELLSTTGAMERLICDTDPVRPSARFGEYPEKKLAAVAGERSVHPRRLSKLIRGELDWIAMKCLEKERDRRYETALSLVADLGRYRRDEPVVASPPSAMYRARKLLRRHRVGLQVGAAFVLLLVAAVVVSLWQATALAQRASAAQEATAIAEDQAEAHLADMFTEKGLDAGSSSLNGRSILWFASATEIPGIDERRIRSSMIRYRNWSHGQWEPVAAVEHPGSDRLAFSPVDSRLLVTYVRNGAPGPARFWYLPTEKEIALPAALGEVRAAAWLPDGRAIVGSVSGTVAILRMPGAEIDQKWETGSPVASVAATEEYAAAGVAENLWLWRLGGGAGATAHHLGRVTYVGFSPAGDRLVTAAEDGKARLFEPQADANGAAFLCGPILEAPHAYHNRWETILPVFTLGGRELMLMDELGGLNTPGRVKWYDTYTGGVVGESTSNLMWPTRDFFPAPDGRTVAFASGDGYMYDARAHQRTEVIGDVSAVAFTSGVRPLIIEGDPSLVLARVFIGDHVGSGTFPELRPPAGGNALAVSPDNRFLAVLQGGVVQVWAIPKREVSRMIPGHVTFVEGSSTWAAFSPDGKYVAPIGGMDGHANVRVVQVIDAEHGSPAGARMTLAAQLASAAFSPDGRWLAMATGVGEPNPGVCMRDWKTGALAWPRKELPADPEWLAMAHNGKEIAVQCVDGRLLLLRASDGSTEWDTRCAQTRDASTGDVPYPAFVGRHGTVLFSHDDRRVYTCGSPTVQAWDRMCGREEYRVVHGSNCWAMAESPDGKILATGSEDGKVVLTSAATGRALGHPIEHGRQVVNVDFNPKGNEMVTCSQDNEMRVWDVASERLLHAMGSVAKLSDATFTPDGDFLAEASGPTVRVWDANIWNMVTPAMRVAGFHTRLDVSSDGHWLVVWGSAQGKRAALPVLDLKQLTSADARDPKDAITWAELLSCGRIDGAAFVRLSNSEWLELWRKYRAKHPGSATATGTGVPW